MAVLAIRAHLPAMYVGVAVGACVSYIGEEKLSVALGAGHVRMHSTQRIPRFVVIELGQVTDRLP